MRGADGARAGAADRGENDGLGLRGAAMLGGLTDRLERGLMDGAEGEPIDGDERLNDGAADREPIDGADRLNDGERLIEPPPPLGPLYEGRPPIERPPSPPGERETEARCAQAELGRTMAKTAIARANARAALWGVIISNDLAVDQKSG